VNGFGVAYSGAAVHDLTGERAGSGRCGGRSGGWNLANVPAWYPRLADSLPTFHQSGGCEGSAVSFVLAPWLRGLVAAGGSNGGDCSTDTARIIDQFGVDRFFVIGWSGGGPHALACSALMPQRVIAVSMIAGIAPWGSPNLDWLAQMGKENIEEFKAALTGPDELRSFLERAGPEFAQVTGGQIIAVLGDLVGDVDKAALTGELGLFLADNTREALRNGFWGWFDDDMAFVRDWGFDLTRIDIPVTVWHGAKDRMAPFAHGRWLAEHLPGARARLLPENGHLSLAVGSFGRILDDLIASGKR
jgi:pimeloyl-ACP methyl ester carboxylesterase